MQESVGQIWQYKRAMDNKPENTCSVYIIVQWCLPVGVVTHLLKDGRQLRPSSTTRRICVIKKRHNVTTTKLDYYRVLVVIIIAPA